MAHTGWGLSQNTVNEVVNRGGQSGGRGDTTDQQDPMRGGRGWLRKSPHASFGEGLAPEDERRWAADPFRRSEKVPFPMMLRPAIATSGISATPSASTRQPRGKLATGEWPCSEVNQLTGTPGSTPHAFFFGNLRGPHRCRRARRLAAVALARRKPM